jgi:hypothetical protein
MRSRQSLVGSLAVLGWLVFPALAAAQIRDDLEALKTFKVPEGSHEFGYG